MLRALNKYCSTCMKTQRFLDLDTYLVCECCSKRLERTRPVSRRGEDRKVVWLDTPHVRREAV